MNSKSTQWQEAVNESDKTASESNQPSLSAGSASLQSASIADEALAKSRDGDKSVPQQQTRRQKRPLLPYLPDPDQLPLFVRNVATWRGLGYSLLQISRKSGVTPQALSVMLVRQKASLLAASRGPGELAGLSPRAVNCLGRLGIGTRAKARRIKELEAKLRAQRNCGYKTAKEILEWAAAS